MSGPPLSPKHASLPCGPTAHSSPLFAGQNRCDATTLTVAALRLSDAGSATPVRPQPATTACSPTASCVASPLSCTAVARMRPSVTSTAASKPSGFALTLVTRSCCPSAPDSFVRPTATVIRAGDATQCCAVSTQRSLMTVPPHSDVPANTCAMYGWAAMLTSAPPTMTDRSRGVAAPCASTAASTATVMTAWLRAQRRDGGEDGDEE